MRRMTRDGVSDDPLVTDQSWMVPRKIWLVDMDSEPEFAWERDTRPNWWRESGTVSFRTDRLVPYEERQALGRVAIACEELSAQEQTRFTGPKAPTRRVLDDFVALAYSTPKRIETFAKTYGPLRLCAGHGAPFVECRLRSKLMRREGATPELCKMIRPESVILWYSYSRYVSGLLRLAAELNRGGGSIPELDRLAGEMTGQGGEYFARQARRTKQRGINHHALLHHATIKWARLLHPDIGRRASGELFYVLGGRGLLGAIAKHLVFAVMRGDGLEVCSGCGSPYTPSRKPRSDQRHFCSDCRDRRVDKKLSQRDYRRRKEGD